MSAPMSWRARAWMSTERREQAGLYTNVAMHQAVAFYRGLDFQEVDRRTEDGFSRVYFRKDVT